VRKWCREFKDGRTDVHDEQRSGWPSVSDEMIAKMEETMLKDRRVTVRELCEMIPDVSKDPHCYLRGAAGEFYDSGIKKMVHRMQKCIDLNSDYVEK
jgi:hypothetical protein